MAYEPKPDSASLFVNKKKEKDTHPDRKGDGMIHCPHCSANFAVELAGWLKESPSAGKFLSLKIKAKEDPGAYRGDKSEAKAPTTPRPPATPPAEPDLEPDEIPW